MLDSRAPLLSALATLREAETPWPGPFTGPCCLAPSHSLPLSQGIFNFLPPPTLNHHALIFFSPLGCVPYPVIHLHTGRNGLKRVVKKAEPP